MNQEARPNIRLISKSVVDKDEQLTKKAIEFVALSKKEPSILDLRWDNTLDDRNYLIYDEDKHAPVGIIGWDGPPYEAEPYFWIHRESRRNLYCTRAVELLAEEMHSKGVVKIKSGVLTAYPFVGKLLDHLRNCFSALKN